MCFLSCQNHPTGNNLLHGDSDSLLCACECCLLHHDDPRWAADVWGRGCGQSSLHFRHFLQIDCMTVCLNVAVILCLRRRLQIVLSREWRLWFRFLWLYPASVRWMVASLLYPGNLGTDMSYLSLMFALQRENVQELLDKNASKQLYLCCISLLGFVQPRENYILFSRLLQGESQRVWSSGQNLMLLWVFFLPERLAL